MFSRGLMNVDLKLGRLLESVPVAAGQRNSILKLS